MRETEAIRKRLLDWFREEARDLPFRRTRDPYLIWLSEIILQQTRVDLRVDMRDQLQHDVVDARQAGGGGRALAGGAAPDPGLR